MKKPATIQLIGILFALIIIAYFFFNYQVFTGTAPMPKPVVVDYKDYVRLPKFKVAMGIKADVRNEGVDGDIVVEATVYQKGRHWTRRQQLYAAANQTVHADLLFDEIKLFGEVEYELRAYPAALKTAAVVISGIHANLESLKDKIEK